MRLTRKTSDIAKFLRIFNNVDSSDPPPPLIPPNKVDTSQASSWSYTQVDVIKVSHGWTIKNFAECKHITGEAFRSAAFYADGREETQSWRLVLYPRGNSDDSKGSLSLFLELCSCDEEKSVDASFRFYVLNVVRSRDQMMGMEHRFRKKGDEVGFPSFVPVDYVLNEQNGFLPDGKLTVYCEVNVTEASLSAARKSFTMQEKSA